MVSTRESAVVNNFHYFSENPARDDLNYLMKAVNALVWKMAVD